MKEQQLIQWHGHSYEMTWMPLVLYLSPTDVKVKLMSHISASSLDTPIHCLQNHQRWKLESVLPCYVSVLKVCVYMCGVLQQWGCWVPCVCVRTGVAGCAEKTCGRTPCCGRPGSAGSWFSWSPQYRPLPCLPSPPRWTKSWVPREGSDAHFPPILTPEIELLTACPRDTPSQPTNEGTCCVWTEPVS